ncbi:PREDICTED: LOW QUALITY PROTEIN: zinc finger protein 239-like [Trachymyrmex cornetzi]|uniref:LOW QUALITY PROTEIN: zinc finger protein 239-like n=1 Tax=Trachymyrmex cornetzi TaxID=471704 RepID=UPI00084F1B70|nr:PREDICTED: LOW QUALITY PROTEIN: zinc finger protein 239-like [Trachymyrmex cornetzi]
MANIDILLYNLNNINILAQLLAQQSDQLMESGRDLQTAAANADHHEPGLLTVTYDVCANNELLERSHGTADVIAQLTGISLKSLGIESKKKSFKFQNSQNLNRYKRAHNDAKEYVCQHCDKIYQFTSSRALKQHNKEVHNEIKPYKCGTYGKTFQNKSRLRRYEMFHAGKKSYQCKFCEQTFTRRWNLKCHIEVKHCNNKNYKCTVRMCKKIFKTQQDLHIDTDHPERKYKYNQCSSTFTYHKYFKVHINIHKSEDPHVCEICGKPCRTKQNLISHSSVHSDKKLFECSVCGKRVSQK